jgi:zinc D-Ala-D-Ala carboxypeptidase
MENISDHISYKEATFTQTRLPNIPNEEELVVMRATANAVFEPMRRHFGVPIGISSFFRSEEVNKKIGGAKNSQHKLGKAIDIDAQLLGGLTNKEIFYYIKDYLDFDQLIWEEGNDEEPDWIHVSYNGDYNRKQVLKFRNKKYTEWKKA